MWSWTLTTLPLTMAALLTSGVAQSASPSSPQCRSVFKGRHAARMRHVETAHVALIATIRDARSIRHAWRLSVVSTHKRPYQSDCTAAIVDSFYNQDVTCQGISLATGGGKTCIVATLPADLGMLPGESVLFIAHRHELIDQAADKFRYYNPTLHVSVERGTQKADPDADVVVASVQSLTDKRIKRFDPDRFRVIVVDECLAGDSQIITDKGMMDIGNHRIANRRVLSFNEETGGWEYRKVLRWIPKPISPTVIIRTSNRTIRCTSDHLMRTVNGWRKAGSLSVTDLILSPLSAPADANSEERLPSPYYGKGPRLQRSEGHSQDTTLPIRTSMATGVV